MLLTPLTINTSSDTQVFLDILSKKGLIKQILKPRSIKSNKSNKPRQFVLGTDGHAYDIKNITQYKDFIDVQFQGKVGTFSAQEVAELTSKKRKENFISLDLNFETIFSSPANTPNEVQIFVISEQGKIYNLNDLNSQTEIQKIKLLTKKMDYLEIDIPLTEDKKKDIKDKLFFLDRYPKAFCFTGDIKDNCIIKSITNLVKNLIVDSQGHTYFLEDVIAYGQSELGRSDQSIKFINKEQNDSGQSFWLSADIVAMTLEERDRRLIYNQPLANVFEKEIRILKGFYHDLTLEFCAIMRKIPLFPVISPYGKTYEQESLKLWFKEHDTFPLPETSRPENSVLNKAYQDFIFHYIYHLKKHIEYLKIECTKLNVSLKKMHDELDESKKTEEFKKKKEFTLNILKQLADQKKREKDIYSEFEKSISLSKEQFEKRTKQIIQKQNDINLQIKEILDKELVNDSDDYSVAKIELEKTKADLILRKKNIRFVYLMVFIFIILLSISSPFIGFAIILPPLFLLFLPVLILSPLQLLLLSSFKEIRYELDQKQEQVVNCINDIDSLSEMKKATPKLIEDINFLKQICEKLGFKQEDEIEIECIFFQLQDSQPSQLFNKNPYSYFYQKRPTSSEKQENLVKPRSDVSISNNSFSS